MPVPLRNSTTSRKNMLRIKSIPNQGANPIILKKVKIIRNHQVQASQTSVPDDMHCRSRHWQPVGCPNHILNRHMVIHSLGGGQHSRHTWFGPEPLSVFHLVIAIKVHKKKKKKKKVMCIPFIYRDRDASKA